MEDITQMWHDACHIWKILHYKVLQDVCHFHILWQALGNFYENDTILLFPGLNSPSTTSCYDPTMYSMGYSTPPLPKTYWDHYRLWNENKIHVKSGTSTSIPTSSSLFDPRIDIYVTLDMFCTWLFSSSLILHILWTSWYCSSPRKHRQCLDVFAILPALRGGGEVGGSHIWAW